MVIDKTQLDAYMGLRAGVYKSCNEATASVWDGEAGCSIFCATMLPQIFPMMLRVIRFDCRKSKVTQHVNDKLDPIRDVWDKWVEKLKFMYHNAAPEVTMAYGICNYTQENLLVDCQKRIRTSGWS